MKNLQDLTVIIVTFNTSEEIILNCLRSINKNVKVLIIENSSNFLHEKIILSQFSNVKIICTGENLGYGKGNNFGIQQVNSEYVLILNPDVICDKDFFLNLPEIINEIDDFAVVGCQYLQDKIFMPAGFFDKKDNEKFIDRFKNNNIEKLERVEWVTGCSMLINLNKFPDKKIFDEKFFLYFEEFDLCLNLVKIGKNIYTSKKLKIHHFGFKSSLDENNIDNTKINNVKDWHYMWSSFYFYKKNYSFLFAIKKLFGKFFRSLFKSIFYTIIFQKKNRKKYLNRFLGLLNSLLDKPPSYRG